ncbi:MAG: N-acetyltransferase [Alphaproteobacteria bacterium]|nr:MAG: N-acetyltransferase [Alphaproteobacteria bacterium]
MKLDFPDIETERLVLRPPSLDDWPGFAAFVASPRSVHVGGPKPEDQAWRAFGHVVGHWVLRDFGAYVVCLKGSSRAIGLVGPWAPVGWPEPEIAWSLWDSAYEGQGIACEAARAARDHAFRTLGWTTAVSYIQPENVRSIRLAERLGARLDDAAPRPDGERCLVYRHPNPGVAA